MYLSVACKTATQLLVAHAAAILNEETCMTRTSYLDSWRLVE